MKSITRSLMVGSSAALLALTCTFAWSQPVASFAASAPYMQESQPDQAQSQTYSGTIVKAGGTYVLQDSSGTAYKLDDSSKAQQFEGKQVKVTGKLDPQSKTIHVESIEGAS